MKFTKKITYESLNPRGKEIFNFTKLSSILIEYGFFCIRFSDDFNGADFVAININNKADSIFCQLKCRFGVYKKYKGKKIHIAFQDRREKDWYIYPHDDAVEYMKKNTTYLEGKSWDEKGEYHFPKLGAKQMEFLAKYKLKSLSQ